ncbi:striatin-3 isoform X1 [Takifugu rubripes]|uniref:striatin-3 isoform X1 n=1 Tax=Takifugu rubripes TaxID=31033 RepID=UPI001145E408|nr:striatin-3 isoform X1 [Takifugu rubripes]XP_029688697.1 striatin-3 isoform X1 [Takifugu rubripes]XP_029688699.1 striatin-3 isoform X1 [Takifugu rubripes]
MDEHPGGGGIGAGASRQPPPQQHGSHSSANPPMGVGGGGGVMVSHQAEEIPRTQQQYTIPGILHYIQHEWARFEMERAHWEVERAELQARIAFLQGERKGQENLKSDLVRRIKMLEYALKQERAKYHKLKYGKELNQGEVKMPSFDSGQSEARGRAEVHPPAADDPNDPWLIQGGGTRVCVCVSDTKDSEVSAVPANSQLTWKQGRQLLRQYLQEVGYTDTILDVRTQRVRSLLGLSGSEQNGSVENKNLQQLINGTEHCKDKRSPGDVLETFNFLENAEDSDEEEDEDGDLMDEISPNKHHRNKKHKSKVGNEGLASEDDADTEEALKEFDFLVTAEDGEGAGEARSSGDGTEWAEPLPFPSGGGKSFLLGSSDDVLESVLGLGDLADLTVANDDTDYSYDLPSCKDSSFRKTWNPKYTLRSHFDGVRALAFHPVEPCLVTVSEDHTLKLWNLTKTVPAKKSASFDVEPIYTFRAHVGPVLSLAMTSSGEQCFSGGLDATIQWWNIPSSNVDPYDTYDPSVLAGSWTGHTDAVWGLAYSGIKNLLLSCSADGTVKLWNPTEKSPCISTFNTNREYGIPTSVDFNGCDPAHMVVSFNSGDVVVYDLETAQNILVLKGQGEAQSASPHINKVVSHPTLPVTITAHEDRHIKFYDNKSGKVIHAMVAHLDAVTSLAVDPNGIYLMSGSHDCSLRLWNLDTKTCVQEITAHRKKSEEAIYDVAFHPSKAFIASAGADALARVYL